MTGCKVTMFNLPRISFGTGGGKGSTYPTCDQPVVAHGLCARHYADRVRLLDLLGEVG